VAIEAELLAELVVAADEAVEETTAGEEVDVLAIDAEPLAEPVVAVDVWTVTVTVEEAGGVTVRVTAEAQEVDIPLADIDIDGLVLIKPADTAEEDASRLLPAALVDVDDDPLLVDEELVAVDEAMLLLLLLPPLARKAATLLLPCRTTRV